ncbi:MAG: TIGR03663 family protein, partial [Phycisphaerae bacterium]|nr:TIGR03663 family protein [Phycisphaerae bacterium]
VRAATLWEEGSYRYDPQRFHGPTLPYLTIPLLKLSSADSFDATSEKHYRAVALLFGLALVFLTALLARELGWPAALAAALLCAVSPALVFFSRYYIHEMLLAVFSFAAILAGGAYGRRPGFAAAATCGLCLALMHATKATCVIAFFAMAVALIVARLTSGQKDTDRVFPWPRPTHFLAGVGAALVAWLVLYSSFFTHWPGLLDSLTTFKTYFARGTASESSALHAHHTHPWHWYLGLLAYHRPRPGPWFSEAPILVLGAIGLVVGLWGRGLRREHIPFARFMAVYTLVLIVVYSAIPYKTPWTMLSFVHGLVILAGIGVATLLHWCRTPVPRCVVALVLALGLAHLAQQSWRVNFRFHSDSRNPYVYAHPTRDVRRLAKRAEQIADVHPEGRAMTIQVLDGDNYWPLPFYLRQFSNVGYWKTDIPAKLDGAMIITDMQHQDAIDDLLPDHQLEHYGLRPNAQRAVYIPKQLWERFIEKRRAGSSP